MGYYICVFEIEKLNFNKNLMLKLIKAVLDNNEIKLDKEEIVEKGNELYNEGKGYDYTLTSLKTRGYTELPVKYAKNLPELMISAKTSHPLNYISSKKVIIRMSISEAYLSGSKERKDAFVNDLVKIYDAIHPNWGRCDFDESFDLLLEELKDYSFFNEMIFPTNFFSSDYVNKIGQEKILSIQAYRIEQLSDGGILLQFSFNPALIDQGIDYLKEVSKKLGLKIGVEK